MLCLQIFDRFGHRHTGVLQRGHRPDLLFQSCGQRLGFGSQVIFLGGQFATDIVSEIGMLVHREGASQNFTLLLDQFFQRQAFAFAITAALAVFEFVLAREQADVDEAQIAGGSLCLRFTVVDRVSVIGQRLRILDVQIFQWQCNGLRDRGHRLTRRTFPQRLFRPIIDAVADTDGSQPVIVKCLQSET